MYSVVRAVVKNSQVRLLVDSFAHCELAVLWPPHGGDGGLSHLQRAGLPCVSVNHAPDTGPRRGTPLRTAANGC